MKSSISPLDLNMTKLVSHQLSRLTLSSPPDIRALKNLLKSVENEQAITSDCYDDFKNGGDGALLEAIRVSNKSLVAFWTTFKRSTRNPAPERFNSCKQRSPSTRSFVTVARLGST